MALKGFAGKVLLVTNVASQCGYTEKNYQGLQRLYDKYRDRGFEARAAPHAWRTEPCKRSCRCGVLMAVVSSRAGCLMRPYAVLTVEALHDVSQEESVDAGH